MRTKTIAMTMVTGCALVMLVGCGVPKEEFEAKVGELNTAWTEIESLKGKNADLESLLNAEKAKVNAGRIELEDATARITASQKKEAETASALADEKAKVVGLEKEVATAQAATVSAQEGTAAVEVELAKLQEEYKKLQVRFEQFDSNMKALNNAQQGTSAPKTAAAAKPAAEKSALDLLNEMSAK